MRLKSIKLAGFKSFVDPTTVHFPSNMCAVVGPNGCGKSNVIDAVRWVMGESSAKNLRGESMADVIFNGSVNRQPIGQASIELIFDNADGKVGGEYAGYSEIATKRQVSREGQSEYFLNGTKCRRKDITGVFLGTGLGPRSYSIIEQGMISEVVDSKPEEIRGHLEEAAGISKYKERRRETERRIQHTRDNLSRLTDLREEVGKHLNRLKRQANAAERYKKFKIQKRELQSNLLALQWSGLRQQTEQGRTGLSVQETAMQEQIAEQRAAEAGREDPRRVGRVHRDRGEREPLEPGDGGLVDYDLTDASGAHRVYDPLDIEFVSYDRDSTSVDRSGNEWLLSEDALRSPSQQTRLPRLPHRRAFWFGWHAAFPDTRLVK